MICVLFDHENNDEEKIIQYLTYLANFFVFGIWPDNSQHLGYLIM